MKRRSFLLFLACAAVLFLPLGMTAQEPPPDQDGNTSKDLDKLVRDQRMIRLRLQRIEEMMDRLSRKYEAEGRQRNADLIRKAREEIRNRNIFKRIEELEQLLSGSRLQVVEKQKEVSRDLEDVFAILQDRNDLERIHDVLGTLEDGIKTAGHLAKEQERLLEETRELIHTEQKLLQQALDKARDLARKQQEVQQRTGEISSESTRADSLLEAADALDALAEREGDLAASLHDALEQRLGEGMTQFTEARREQEALAGRLERMTAREEGNGTPPDLSDLLRRQISAGRAAREAAARISADQGGELPEALRGLEEEIARAESALESGNLADAANKAAALASQMKAMEKEIGKGGNGALAPEQEAILQEIEKMEEKLKAVEPADAAAEAQEKTAGAKERAARASSSLEDGSDAAAAAEAKEASEQLREAAEALRKAWGNEAGRRKADAARLGDDQESLAREAGEMSELMKTAERVSGEKGKYDAEEAMAREAAAAMKGARSSLGSGKASAAQDNQERAEQKLEDLIKALEEKEKQAASGQEGGQAGEQQRAEKYQDLAKRQKELEEETHDLMRRLREYPDKKPLGHLSKAAENMWEAAGELANQEGEDAAQDEEDAQKYLEKALQEMKLEKEKYQELRQREVLFRVRQELEALKEEQDAINKETATFDEEREGARLRRSQKRKLSQLADRENTVRERTVEVKEKIEEDGSTVFTYILEHNREDLDEVVGSLRSGETGDLMRAIQDDISRRYGDLIAALKEEIKRRMEAPTKKGDNKNPQEPSLIPSVAELIMIKAMEESALKRLEEFMIMNPEVFEEGASPVQRRLLDRLGHQHAGVRELFEEMLGRVGMGEPKEGEEKK